MSDKQMRPMVEAFFNFISRKNAGEVVSQAEVLAATKWTVSTLKTHENKNGLQPFLQRVHGKTSFRVRRDGDTITRKEVADRLTQKRPVTFLLSPGTPLSGELANYELIEELGNGAVGHVWKAKKILNSELVAVKVLDPRPDLLDPKVIEDVKRRFAREAKNGLAIHHENIIPYLDHGTYEGTPFMVMALAAQTLAKRIAKGTLTVGESLAVIRTCASGLLHLASKSSPHRDVKPDNILLFDGRYVLGDLGVVKWSDMNPEFMSAGTMTRDSLRLGSWYYMAPEQRTLAHAATAASDVYALGVSWNEMLTGNTLDPTQVVAGDFDNPCGHSNVNALIRRMLKYKPSERPSLDELLELVESFTKSSAPSDPSP